MSMWIPPPPHNKIIFEPPDKLSWNLILNIMSSEHPNFKLIIVSNTNVIAMQICDTEVSLAFELYQTNLSHTLYNWN